MTFFAIKLWCAYACGLYYIYFCTKNELVSLRDGAASINISNFEFAPRVKKIARCRQRGRVGRSGEDVENDREFKANDGYVVACLEKMRVSNSSLGCSFVVEMQCGCSTGTSEAGPNARCSTRYSSRFFGDNRLSSDRGESE